MGKLLLKNARIINPGGSPSYLDGGVIAVSKGTITFVGQNAPIDERFDEEIDLQGKTVLPGMINAHTHLYSALALGMPGPGVRPANFVDILESIWWKLDLALDEDSTRASYEAGLMACLRAGVTTVIDHHSSPNYTAGSLDSLADVARQMGLNICVAFEVTDRNGQDLFEAGLEENLAAMSAYAGDAHIHPMVGLHASFTLSDESLRAVRDALEAIPGWGIHIHVAEDVADLEDALARGYRSVVQRLQQFDLLNGRSLAVHGLHLLEGDVPLLKESGAALVHNPTSNANNRVGLLAPDTIRELGAGLGTDGMQANMLSEAKEGTLIRSAHLEGGADNVDYLALLFKNNPAIASNLFGRKLGCIMPGYQADLAIYDYHPRTELNGENAGGHLLFGLPLPSDVLTRGLFRIRDGKFVDLPAHEINARAKAQSVKLWTKMALI